ncbi:hypothetical protein NTE_01116 [Candidatus Nitrososphaera evergladensis SR1]|jgi:hypothetical protein|uniref:Yip1 domain-containing protein n=1 Tax=Candidatus Nitrososphaera evergladensis SR1 TaxID=1459636 RepID=A0A075MV87_9ARCH|nr:hypothetical protein NTE_01116 [Candidatus Nitrososphaera evergladensis SR1]
MPFGCFCCLDRSSGIESNSLLLKVTITCVANEIIYAISFVISLIVSTVIIYIVTKLFGEKEGIGRAFLAAIIGAIVYSVSYFLFGTGWLAAIIGGFVWLLALRGLYGMGWLKSLAVAVIIWVFAAIAGLLLPTVAGPL